MRIFVNAGHHLLDKGAWHKNNPENKLAIELRDIVVPLLQEHVEVISVPDSLNLKETIAWINARAIKDDLAFSIHFNANSNKHKRGTEVYFHNEREKQIGLIFADKVSSALNIWNRGTIEDIYSWVGSLGWLRKLICDSVLVEVCYLTNKDDMDAYTPQKAAQGLLNAIIEIIPKKELEEPDKSNTDAKEECEQQVSRLKAIVAWLVRIVNLITNKK